jgi:HSP20 family molecular chaperone IbpA
VAEKAQASLKDGVLTVTIPKVAQEKVKKIRVKPE